MTLISALATEAFRENNLIAVGASPTAAEQAEAVTILQRFILSLFGDEAGDYLRPLNLGKQNIQTVSSIDQYMDDLANYYVPKNTQLICNINEETTVNLDPSPNDGQRVAVQDVAGVFATYNLILEGNGRLIESATSVTLSTNDLIRQWFYRADLGDWVRLTSLATTDSSPFPTEFDDLLVIGTAFRLNPRHGATTDPQTLEYFKMLRSKFRNRYTQLDVTGVEDGLTRLSSWDQNYGRLGSNEAFNRGLIL